MTGQKVPSSLVFGLIRVHCNCYVLVVRQWCAHSQRENVPNWVNLHSDVTVCLSGCEIAEGRDLLLLEFYLKKQTNLPF